MTTISDDKIKEFTSLFDGDIASARAALDSYEQRRDMPITTSHANRRLQSIGDEIISVQHVSKHYLLGKQTVDALREVTLSIGKGEFVAITGASGSGKSTLLQIIGCLDKPTSGRVAVESEETTRLSDSALSDLRQHAIGFIFQSFYLQPFLNLATNLEIPGMFARTNPRERKQRAAELADMVNIAERMKHLPKELSGGQMQRAAIARALLNQPKVLLADEPTGNLDSVNSQRVIDIFEQVRRQLGTTILIVTHDYEIARQTDREITLHDGRVL